MNLIPAILVWSVLRLPTPVPALAPGNLIIVYNHNLPESENLARYHAAKRRVPVDNLLAVIVPASASISRDDYETQLAEPVA